MVFWSLCLFGAILAQKLNSFICEKKILIFWHPWDPWGRIHIDLNKNSVQTGCVPLITQLSRNDMMHTWIDWGFKDFPKEIILYSLIPFSSPIQVHDIISSVLASTTGYIYKYLLLEWKRKSSEKAWVIYQVNWRAGTFCRFMWLLSNIK